MCVLKCCFMLLKLLCLMYDVVVEFKLMPIFLKIPCVYGLDYII